MTITLNPATEAKLIRFATARGLPPEEALDEAMDELLNDISLEEDLDQEPSDHPPMSTIPEILLRPAADAIKKALSDMDAGKGTDGAAFLAELGTPFICVCRLERGDGYGHDSIWRQ